MTQARRTYYTIAGNRKMRDPSAALLTEIDEPVVKIVRSKPERGRSGPPLTRADWYRSPGKKGTSHQLDCKQIY